MKSQECPENKVAKVWHTTMGQSIFGRLDAQAVGLSSVVLAFWLLSFVQMVYRLIQTLGRGCCRGAIGRRWG